MRNCLVALVTALALVLAIPFAMGASKGPLPKKSLPVAVHPVTASSIRASSTTAGPQKIDVVERYRPILFTRPMAAPKVVAKHSHYNDPIDRSSNRLAGRSRRGADASLEVQAALADRTVIALRAAGFSERRVAFGLATLCHESGLNPDAANGSGSDSGLPQMVDRTRASFCRKLGLDPSDPFDSEVNIRCFVEHLKECFAFAKRKGLAADSDEFFVMSYAYYHDGPTLSHGGAGIGRSKLLPQMNKVLACLRK